MKKDSDCSFQSSQFDTDFNLCLSKTGERDHLLFSPVRLLFPPNIILILTDRAAYSQAAFQSQITIKRLWDATINSVNNKQVFRGQRDLSLNFQRICFTSLRIISCNFPISKRSVAFALHFKLAPQWDLVF